MNKLFDHVEKLPSADLFTDGACIGNPGPGGWAYIIKFPDRVKPIVMAGAERQTTNNRMELSAVIQGLRRLGPAHRVHLYSDSEYVLKGIKEWMDGWKKRGWRKADKKPVLNVELWQELDELRHLHDIHTHWIRGHTGHPENELCDQMATAEADKIGGGLRRP